MDETSAELKSIVGTVGKSNSIRKHYCASPFWIFELSDALVSGNFLAVRIMDSVTNSIMWEFTKPNENNACAAANVAWPQSSICKRASKNFYY